TEAQVFGARAVLAFGLDIDLPLAAEAVEVVHEVTAHERLQRFIDLGEFHTLLERLIAVNVDVNLRDDGQEGGVDAGDLRTFASCFHEPVNVGSQKRNVLASAVLQHKRKSA